ncbi:MAG: histidine--tRNA ligase [Eubacteriales bacterium]
MSDKVTPRILQGFAEFLPKEQILFNEIYDKIRSVYEKYGFLPLDTPTIEYSEVLLAKAGGETEKQIYRFTKGDNDLSLRFDLTVPLARYVSMHENELVFPFKRYQMSKVFRGERPQKGRFREFYQCDIDIIGADELPLIYDAEMPAVICDVFRSLNLGDFTIRLNNRKILGGFFAAIGLDEKKTEALRAIDKLEKIGADGVRKELYEIGASEDAAERILDFVGISGTTDEILHKLSSLDGMNETFKEGVSELSEVIGYMRAFGIPEKNFALDLTIARGLDYYTGTVYETVLNDYKRLGSVCSGGRYENLTGYYTDKKMPGIGISIGLTRLFSQLLEAGLISSDKGSVATILIVPMDKNALPFSLSVSSKFRAAGIATDLYLLEKGMKQKMKYADRLGIPFVAIIGDNEVQNGMMSIKNMKQGGEQLLLTPDDAIDFLKSRKE